MFGLSQGNFGVRAVSTDGVGLRATSVSGRALEATADQNGIGVVAQSTGSDGVFGISGSGVGVHGVSQSNFGVRAVSTDGVGLRATSVSGRALEASADQNGIGVVAQSTGGDGVFGISGTGIGVHGKGGKLAGFFEGDVQVSGTLHVAEDVVLTGGDCAEHFDAKQDAIWEPGTVMTISIGGALDASSRAYDKKVAGVVSGAGSFRPAILLDYQASDIGRPAVALNGKVYVKVDAEYGAIEVGDLLTTSDTPGHAMKVTDPGKGFGAVIGKALQSLGKGKGLIPILIALA